MFLTGKWFQSRLNAIVLFVFIFPLSLVDCGFYDEKQETSYTEAILNITFCESSGKNCIIKSYDDAGIFGYHSPTRSARGWLYALVSSNVNGCKEFNVKVDKIPWIALIERGICNFEDKIDNAFKHNASAVIIYDHTQSDTPVMMSHIEADQIVAVSIKRNLGMDLARVLVNRTKAVFLEISVGETHTKWQVNPTSVLFVSVSFIVLMVISLAWLVFYYVQRFRYVHARDKTEKRLTSAAKKAIAKLSTRTVSKKTEDDEMDSCAVCLDGYKASDIIRILPCQHEFHKQCIDPWLVEHRTCPMCKLNILKELGVASEENQTQDVEVGTAELQEQEDHQNAADNPGVVMGEIEPVATPRRPSSDTSESSSVSGSGRVLHVSAEVNWEREDQSSSTSNLMQPASLQA